MGIRKKERTSGHCTHKATWHHPYTFVWSILHYTLEQMKSTKCKLSAETRSCIHYYTYCTHTIGIRDIKVTDERQIDTNIYKPSTATLTAHAHRRLITINGWARRVFNLATCSLIHSWESDMERLHWWYQLYWCTLQPLHLTLIWCRMSLPPPLLWGKSIERESYTKGKIMATILQCFNWTHSCGHCSSYALITFQHYQ